MELLLKRIRESLAERELSLNLSEGAADLLVEKGWDPAMGARPLRRAIQRYIEDPLADEVLVAEHAAGLDGRGGPGAGGRRARGHDQDPQGQGREPVGVGAKGAEAEEGADEGGPEQSGGPDLPDEPEVLPDVPDAPPRRLEGDEPEPAQRA